MYNFNLHAFRGEQILFRKDFTKGFWKPKIVKSYILTNRRVITMMKGKGVEQLMLEDIGNAVPMNMHSMRDGTFQTYGVRQYTGLRFNLGKHKSKGRTAGNIVFIPIPNARAPEIQWFEVADPRSIINLIKALKSKFAK